MAATTGRDNMRALQSIPICVLMIGVSAHAEAQATSEAPAALIQNTGALEEIVVTAQKRSENSQRIPITITAVDAAELQASGVDSTKNLAFVVPSLVYEQTGAYAQPFLRGIGSTLTIPNADPSVTTYVDGVVVSTTAGIV